VNDELYEKGVAALLAAPVDAAKDIYETQVFARSLARFRAAAQPCDLLVLTAGTQPYSVALSLARAPARSVVLIHTDDSLSHAQRGAELAGVDRDLLRFRQVDKADSASVYRHIRDAIQGDRSGVVIDFTSGTKAMTAAASAAAGYLGVAQVYIESTYLRPGYFGRELVHVVDHPLVIFGDAKREEAERFYEQGAWAPAEFTSARRTGRWRRCASSKRMLRSLPRVTASRVRGSPMRLVSLFSDSYRF
jgi:CRISPR-associated protein (Cas_Cas02710)